MSASKDPPQLPTVVDEAGESPSWLPWLGAGLFLLAALAVAARQATQPRAPEDAAEAAASAGAAAEAPPANEPAAAPSAPTQVKVAAPAP